ncbi:hypothetical protein N643_13375 [Salmonella bongori serovar 48:z41:-- str. RKS3044]|nr:hypothetical protein N643_13375 [Salmonella bongori serovar 48:z41:-- str. RKS3044]
MYESTQKVVNGLYRWQYKCEYIFFPELVNSQKVKSFGLEFIINKIQEIEK